jgi:hypothetical protein
VGPSWAESPGLRPTVRLTRGPFSPRPANKNAWHLVTSWLLPACSFPPKSQLPALLGSLDACTGFPRCPLLPLYEAPDKDGGICVSGTEQILK